MGAQFSAIQILSSFTGDETITETLSDNRTVITRRKNPLIASLTITAATCIY